MIPLSPLLPFFYSSRREPFTPLTTYLPNISIYDSLCTYFSIFYIKWRAHAKGRFSRAMHRLRLGTVFFRTPCSSSSWCSSARARCSSFSEFVIFIFACTFTYEFSVCYSTTSSSPIPQDHFIFLLSSILVKVYEHS